MSTDISLAFHASIVNSFFLGNLTTLLDTLETQGLTRYEPISLKCLQRRPMRPPVSPIHIAFGI